MKPPALDLELQHQVVFSTPALRKLDFRREFNFNYIFSNQTLSDSFSLIVAWMLGNTADESDCRGVLITQKLSAADRQLSFFNYKTTSSAEPFPPSTKHTAPIWSLGKVKVLKNCMNAQKMVKKNTKQTKELRGDSPVVMQCCQHRSWIAQLLNPQYCTQQSGSARVGGIYSNRRKQREGIGKRSQLYL